MDEDQNSVEPEVTPQDPDSTIVEQEAPMEAAEQPPVQEEAEQDRNWRELRKKEQEAQQKVKMQEDLIKNLVQAQQAQVPPPQPPKPEDDGGLGALADEDYPTKGQSKKLMRKEWLEFERERNRERFKERLNERYSDFDEIVNSETIAILDKQKPELARTIAALGDPYQMGLQTYEFIKALNMKEVSTENRHAREVQKKIDKNEKSIQTPQAYNKRPMAQAFSMTKMSDDEKTKLHNEMLGYASQTPGY